MSYFVTPRLYRATSHEDIDRNESIHDHDIRPKERILERMSRE